MLTKLKLSFLKLHNLPVSTFAAEKLKIHKAAVILSGAGKADGSEITEAVSILISLSKLGAKFQCYAPNKLQKDVIDHIAGQPLNETRNVLIESARISRGDIRNLAELNSKDYHALFMPGGFGAAKNWSNFAEKGPNFKVDEDIEKVLLSFYEEGKPIGACCIAPIILAKVLGKKNVTLTLGKKTKEWEFSGTIDAAKSFGAQHEEKDTCEICVDKKNKIVTSPAFMKSTATFYEVFDGISKMVEKTNELA